MISNLGKLQYAVLSNIRKKYLFITNLYYIS